MRVALVAPLVSAIAQPYLGGAQALLVLWAALGVPPDDVAAELARNGGQR